MKTPNEIAQDIMQSVMVLERNIKSLRNEKERLEKLAQDICPCLHKRGEEESYPCGDGWATDIIYTCETCGKVERVSKSFTSNDENGPKPICKP